jgi:O-succinylhomoserine sulfhydrylase
MSGGGGIVVLDLDDLSRARRFVDALELASHTGNLGDSRTIVTHPASTTHAKLTEEERARVAITPGLIRISVGLEHVDDIIADLAQALEQSRRSRGATAGVHVTASAATTRDGASLGSTERSA